MTQSDREVNLFPAYHAIKMPKIGICICDDSIRSVELESSPEGDMHSLKNYGSIPLPEGVIQGDKIADPLAVQKALSRLAAEKNYSFAHILLPETQAHFFRLEIPESDTPETLRSAIRQSLQGELPFSPEQAVIDFVVEENKDGKAIVSALVAQKEILAEYGKLFSHAGITILSVGHKDHAVFRSVTKEGEEGTRLIVDFGEDSSAISLFSNGKAHYITRLDIGRRMVIQALTREFDVSSHEASKILHEFGLRRTVSDDRPFAVVADALSPLRNTLNKIIVSWNSSANVKERKLSPIEEITLSGDSHIAGFTDYLSASLRLRTVSANVRTNLRLPDSGIPPIPLSESHLYAPAIGAALHRNVPGLSVLVPQEHRVMLLRFHHKKQFLPKFLFAIGIVFLLVWLLR